MISLIQNLNTYNYNSSMMYSLAKTI